MILAAGLGRRLGSMTAEKTKGMVVLHGRTLLERSLDALVDHGVDRVVLVVGYGAAGVRDLVGDRYRGTPVVYVENEVYDSTNNIYSLYLAADELRSDDTLLLESDLVYDPAILTRLLAHPHEDVATVAAHEEWMDGTMVTLGPHDEIEAFVPPHLVDGTRMDRYFKTVNIYKLSRRFLEDHYWPFLQAYVRSMGPGEYYEQVLRVITNLDRHGLVGMPLRGERWYEIDDPEDYRVAATIFADGAGRHEALVRRDGGYWRFPSLVDFAHPATPFLPPAALTEELARLLPTLLAARPSAPREQHDLAATALGCEPGTVVVGTGTADLLSRLAAALPGERIGVAPSVPAAYRAAVGPDRVVTAAPDASTTAGRLRVLLEEAGTLLLADPDPDPDPDPDAEQNQEQDRGGPAPEERDDLLAHATATQRRLVVDDSLDVAGERTGGLLDPAVLAAHPRLVVLRDLGRSHGVPGLGLAVLATADADLLAGVAGGGSPPAIGSVAESYLQLLGRHRRAHAEAGARLREERERLRRALGGVPGLDVPDSHGDALVCRTVADAGGLARRLLAEHDLLVPTCGPDRLRVAVRRPEENDRLVAALHALA